MKTRSYRVLNAYCRIRYTARQGLTLAHIRAQLEDLREHIALVRAQLEHLRDTSTGYVGSYGGHRQLKLSRKGQSKLKLSRNGNECKPLPHAPSPARAGTAMRAGAAV
jgi:hypothetical protein